MLPLGTSPMYALRLQRSTFRFLTLLQGGHNTDGFDVSSSTDLTITGAYVNNQDVSSDFCSCPERQKLMPHFSTGREENLRSFDRGDSGAYSIIFTVYRN